MKSLKKILSIFAAFMMVVGLTAANVKAETTTKGTITITNAVKGETYVAYKIFDAQYTDDAVSYTASTAVKNKFENTDDLKNYFTFNPTGDSNVWNVVQQGTTPIDAKALSEALREYVGTDPFTQSGSVTAGEDDTSVTISNLPSGYYYVTSSLGTLVTIDTTHPNASITDKNTDKVPTPDKEIDSTLNADAYAQIGEIIPYTVTFKAYEGAKNYVLVDTMSAGLELQTTAPNVPTITFGNTTVTLDTDNKFMNGTTEVATFQKEGQTMTIVFNDTWLKSYTDNATTEGKEIVVKYSAKVTEDAMSMNTENNSVHINYGNDQHTTTDTVNVYKGQLNVFKFHDTNSTENALAGAEFKLVKNGETESLSVKQVTEGVNGNYIVSANAEENTVQTLVSGNDGYIKVYGLEDGTYTLTETKAPDGYNLATQTFTFTISSQNGDNKGITVTTPVENKKGSTLPSTGGMGTTMIYIAGAILMVGAAIIFVTNKRMKHE